MSTVFFDDFLGSFDSSVTTGATSNTGSGFGVEVTDAGGADIALLRLKFQRGLYFIPDPFL